MNDDNNLALLAKEGDMDALVDLVERNERFVYVLTYRATFDPDTALDITQDVFLRLVEKLHLFGGGGSFHAWLRTITIHAIADHFRKSSRHELVVDPFEMESLSRQDGESETEMLIERLDEESRRALVWEAAKRLPEQKRMIFVLRFSEGMKFEEIADTLEISVNQATSQFSRAVKAVRREVRKILKTRATLAERSGAIAAREPRS